MNLKARHSTLSAVLCLLIIVAATVTLVWEVTPGLLKNGRSRPAARSVSSNKILVANDAPSVPLTQLPAAVLPPSSIAGPAFEIVSQVPVPSRTAPAESPVQFRLIRGPPQA
jgi:hypothetical protein